MHAVTISHGQGSPDPRVARPGLTGGGDPSRMSVPSPSPRLMPQVTAGGNRGISPR